MYSIEEFYNIKYLLNSEKVIANIVNQIKNIEKLVSTIYEKESEVIKNCNTIVISFIMLKDAYKTMQEKMYSDIVSFVPIFGYMSLDENWLKYENIFNNYENNILTDINFVSLPYKTFIEDAKTTIAKINKKIITLSEQLNKVRIAASSQKETKGYFLHKEKYTLDCLKITIKAKLFTDDIKYSHTIDNSDNYITCKALYSDKDTTLTVDNYAQYIIPIKEYIELAIIGIIPATIKLDIHPDLLPKLAEIINGSFSMINKCAIFNCTNIGIYAGDNGTIFCEDHILCSNGKKIYNEKSIKTKENNEYVLHRCCICTNPGEFYEIGEWFCSEHVKFNKEIDNCKGLTNKINKCTICGALTYYVCNGLPCCTSCITDKSSKNNTINECSICNTLTTYIHRGRPCCNKCKESFENNITKRSQNKEEVIEITETSKKDINNFIGLQNKNTECSICNTLTYYTYYGYPCCITCREEKDLFISNEGIKENKK